MEQQAVGMETTGIVILSTLAVLLVLGILAWLGLRVRPRPFPPYPEQTPTRNTAELPGNLPEPVSRFYETILGDRIPIIESAVITGRGSLRFRGITFPARLRFTHDAGLGYRHYIEATIFGFPLMKVNEHYLDGKSRMELPVGVIENEPKVDMAANLGLWGESVWLPSIFVTNPRVRWEPIDDTTARLVVPFGEEEDSFTVTFDAESSLMQSMEALRYREATDDAKIPWLLEALECKTFHGVRIPSLASVTWQDEGTPWLIIEVEEVAFNVDIEEYIRARGP
jgi:hypothetical protein